MHNEDLRALTVHEPWASLIAYELKPVENRTWVSTFMLGRRVAIHAGQKVDFEGAEVLIELAAVRGEVVYRQARRKDVVRVDRSHPQAKPAYLDLTIPVGGEWIPMPLYSMAILAVATVRGFVHESGQVIVPEGASEEERAYVAGVRLHPYFSGPWGWVLGDVKRLEVPARLSGAQGLWMVPQDERERIARARWAAATKASP